MKRSFNLAKAVLIFSPVLMAQQKSEGPTLPSGYPSFVVKSVTPDSCAYKSTTGYKDVEVFEADTQGMHPGDIMFSDNNEAVVHIYDSEKQEFDDKKVTNASSRAVIKIFQDDCATRQEKREAPARPSERKALLYIYRQQARS